MVEGVHCVVKTASPTWSALTSARRCSAHDTPQLQIGQDIRPNSTSEEDIYRLWVVAIRHNFQAQGGWLSDAIETHEPLLPAAKERRKQRTGQWSDQERSLLCTFSYRWAEFIISFAHYTLGTLLMIKVFLHHSLVLQLCASTLKRFQGMMDVCSHNSLATCIHTLLCKL